MRRCYLVCYDISSPKRWRRVYKVMQGYGEHWQYSVFFCILRDIDRVRMEAALDEYIKHDEDQTLILDLGPDEKAARESATVLGLPLEDTEERTVIV